VTVVVVFSILGALWCLLVWWLERPGAPEPTSQRCGVCGARIEGLPHGGVQTERGFVVTCSHACVLEALAFAAADRAPPSGRRRKGEPN
jgi:hypothetical protein